MRSLIQFLLRHYFILLFILYVGIGVFFLVGNNAYHQGRFAAASRYLMGNIYTRSDYYRQFFSLKADNAKLLQENSQLRNKLPLSLYDGSSRTELIKDTVYRQQFQFMPARVINNSTNKQHNYLTLNKGKLQGVKAEMGVVSSFGVVGVVKGVSDNYATVISLLNQNLQLSVKIKKNSYFGALNWDGNDYRTALLTEIPIHVGVEKGDTIITSGFSSIFPEGVPVGLVNSYRVKGGNFLEIKVDLITNFKSITEVYVVSNLMKDELE